MFFIAAASVMLRADDDKTMTITGRVKDAMSRKDLVKSKVYITDSVGNHVDSITTGGSFWGDASGAIEERAVFSFNVPRRKAIYNIEVVMPEYQNFYYTLRLDKFGRREFERELPDFYLERAPHKLDGVTVTASKIKFYNRGDTIVYNADAFELAEGSMLDALVKQLPGVELREGGQIYVNGEFVESLLMNGNDFFKGNNELMLDNLAAYTVKNIEVYKKNSDLDQWQGTHGKENLVMDVKLKKEYNSGWLMNFEAGAGSSERYLGRAFINRYTNNSRITFIANVNNLNDNRKPGESSTWTPETNTTGTMRTQMGALDYNAQHRDELWKVSGNATVRHSTQNDTRDINRINFLPSLQTYDYSFTRNRFEQLTASTDHNFIFKNKQIYLRSSVTGNYNKDDYDSKLLSATFNNERPGATASMIDSLYTASPDQIDDIVNRTMTRTLSSGHSANGSFGTGLTYNIPRTPDYVSFRVSIDGSESKNEVWRDYTINYGSNPDPAIRENQYFDNSPNRDINLNATVSYTYQIAKDFNIRASYNYTHGDKHRDSYMYALDRLTDMGVIGTLPANFLSSFDPARSYRSHTVSNEHTPLLNITYWTRSFNIYFSPSLKIVDQNFGYYRNDVNYRICQKHTMFTIANYEGQISKSLGRIDRGRIRHNLGLNLSVQNTLPDPVRMVDVTDNNDPMNIWVGNDRLTYATTCNAELKWYANFPIGERILTNNTQLIFTNTHNALVNGYTYDTSTGVRTNRTYNLSSGNWTAKIHVQPRLQFGSKQQFTAYYNGGLDIIHSADMIGINAETPTPYDVITYWQAHTLNLNWQFGKNNIQFMGQINSRHTDSNRDDFRAITATHSNYSLRGVFNLPKGFGISTDITLYMRRGYGSEELDTTEPVWNARLTYTPPRSKFVLMLDGFDLLHQLSNVNYAVNAQGRTITFTNVLPRYIMFHVQYRLNIQPKKKIIDNRPEWAR
ncbi:MAG: hypothetical protein NC336_09550 [Clostridium sp.]|nr:hypothetical protein [Clostridium sp.]